MATASQGLIARLGANLSGYRKGLRAAVRDAQGSGRKMKLSMAGPTKAAKMLAKTAALVGVAFVGVGIAAIKMASDFETAMSEVSTLLEVSLDGMGELTAAVKGLSLQFGVSLTEQARALYQTISAGATDAADATNILTVANKAAVAGVSDVATSVEAIMRVINAYNLSSSEAARVSDGLFTIVKKGVTTFGELAPIIGRVAGTAATVGVSMEELFAIIATGTKTLTIDETITGTNQLLLAFVSRTSDTNKAARSLGVQFDASSLSVKGVAGVLGEVIDKLGVSMAELQQMVSVGEEAGDTMERLSTRTGVSAEIIQALFPNVRALKVALALVKGEGKEFTEQLGFQNDAMGATQFAFEKMSATFGFMAKQVKQEVAVAFVNLGDTLIPVAREVAGAIGTIVRETSAWIDTNRDLIRQNVEQVFTAVVRGVGRAAESLLNVVNFFRNNPIAGEFGLVGLIFLGPAGAVALTLIGRVIDGIIGELFGATDVAGRLQQNIDEAQSSIRRLMTEGAMGGNKTAEEMDKIAEEVIRLNGIIEMNQRTLDNLGPQAETAFGRMLEGARSLAQGMQDFDFGDFLGGFEEAGIEDTIEAVTEGIDTMVFRFAPLPVLGNEFVTALGEGVKKTSLLSFVMKRELLTAVQDVGEMVASGIGDAIADVITRTDSLIGAMKRLGQMILSQVVSALVRAAVLTAVINPLLGGLGLPIQAFATGGIVQGRGGAGVPIIAHAGEVILSRDAVASLGGASQANQINQGGAQAQGSGPVQVSLKLDASKMPPASDFNIIAANPDLVRFVSEILRQVEFARS